MQIPYSFLQKQVNKQFKDLAFFEILKRKGPYIQRSLTKIQNDLFYKHKLSGTKMKNVSFIKQIRLTLAAYQVIVNQIKNDFMMTQLDSLGDSIHKLFIQMISIINFFSAIILKKQKLAINDLKDINLQQLRQKQQVIKKMQQQQRSKVLQQRQKQNDRLKEIQKLKYNFRQLFKMQINSDKQNKLIQNLWKAIVMENKNNVKQCMKIKDSELDKIIKDSCQYLYKNHTELDNIVRLTKQDMIQQQKTLNGFGDKAHLLQENQQKINHMKSIAKDIIQYIRQKVYDKKNALVQTNYTNIDTSRPYMTTKQLDQKRKMNQKIKMLQKTNKQKLTLIQQIQKKLRQTQDKLVKTEQKLYEIQNNSQSDDEDDKQSNKQSSKNSNSNNPLTNKLMNLSRKSKHNNFNSFKVNPSKNGPLTNKMRQASFTVGKKFSKLSKVSYDSQQLYQKNSNRSSTTSKDFTLGYRNSNYNNKSTKNILSNYDLSSITSNNTGSTNKKFYKVRQSNLVVQAKSFQQISRKSQKSRIQTINDDDQHNFGQKEKSIHDAISIQDIKSCRQQDNQINSCCQNNQQQNLNNNQTKKSPQLYTISQTVKINIKPLRLKRYLQSTYKHPLSQQKPIQHLLQSRLLKSSKLKKSTSQHEISRYFFQPLDNFQRFGPITHYKQLSKIQQHKKKVLSATSSPKSVKFFQKQNNQSNSKFIHSNTPQLNMISFIKLKNQRLNKSKQNSSILKGCIKNKRDQKQSKKQRKNILKKSSSLKQSVSFAFIPGSQTKTRKSMYYENKNVNSQQNQNKINRITIGCQSDANSIAKKQNSRIIEHQIIKQQNENYD